MPARLTCVLRCLLVFGTVLIGTLLIGIDEAVSEDVSAFSFMHISDMHINPQPVGTPDPGPDSRSVSALAWICEESKKPQQLVPIDVTTGPPSFVIATGDLTEYGVIHTTWDQFERHFAPLEIPLYLTPGNHDNTWTAMLSIMRERHGGDHYGFDAGGCHFICFDTATPQEATPSIDRRTLTWLEGHLKTVDHETPIFMFCHHPLAGGGFSKPYEQLRLLQLIENHNVVLLLMGHGHAVRHEKWGKLDSVMGGSTFGKNTGYSVVRVADGRLSVNYRYRDHTKSMPHVLDKSLAYHKSAMTLTASVAALRPREDQVQIDAALTLEGALSSGSPVDADLTVMFDGQEEGMSVWSESLTFETRPLVKTLTLTVSAPWVGRHFLRVHGRIGEDLVDRTCEFDIPHHARKLHAQRTQLESGMKAKPLVVGDDVIVATTSGRVLHLTKGKEDTPEIILETGVEILRAPRLIDDMLYVSAAEKGVIAVDLQGRVGWTCDVGSVVYGTPAVDDDSVYVGDLEGIVHAIDRKTGKLKWSKRHALFSIEQPVLLHEGVLYFGAWDGFLYAVRCEDGELAWKTRTPAGQSGGKMISRYYGGGDNTPILVGEHLVMTDRAYWTGAYSLAGEYLGDLGKGISGLATSTEGDGFFARAYSDGLRAYDRKGTLKWTAPAELGAFPIPPTVHGDRVYVCSNRGRLRAVDAASGEVIWHYQVTPRLPVMAPVAVTESGDIIIADMDGVVTRLRVQP